MCYYKRVSAAKPIANFGSHLPYLEGYDVSNSKVKTITILYFVLDLVTNNDFHTQKTIKSS